MTTEWTGPYRGLCRVTGITATITLKTRIECEAGCNTARENWCCFGMINCGGDTMRRHCLDAYNTCVGKCPPSSYAGGTVVAKPYKSLDGGSDRSEFYLNSIGGGVSNSSQNWGWHPSSKTLGGSLKQQDSITFCEELFSCLVWKYGVCVLLLHISFKVICV